MLGIVAFKLGVHDWSAAASVARRVLWSTVATRPLVLIAFTALVILGLAQPMLIVFGANRRRRRHLDRPCTDARRARGAIAFPD
jgi:hypothetical protein